MLIQGHQCAQDFGRQLFRKENVARPVARKETMVRRADQPTFWRSGFRASTKSKRFGLRQTMGRQDILML